MRDLRATAGLGLAELGERAEVSRRYLTDAEAGRANPTIGLLARLADALDVELVRLLDFPVRRRSRERVALIGLRGAGKSTVGRELSLALEVPFCELDSEVEHEAGLELSQIFELHGAEGFHRFEAEALERILGSSERQVIAAGGSIVESPETYSRLLETCRCIWLTATPSEHLSRVLDQGDRRPVRGRPRAFGELEAILQRRQPAYVRAELQVPTSGRSVPDVVGAIVEHLERPGEFETEIGNS